MPQVRNECSWHQGASCHEAVRPPYFQAPFPFPSPNPSPACLIHIKTACASTNLTTCLQLHAQHQARRQREQRAAERQQRPRTPVRAAIVHANIYLNPAPKNTHHAAPLHRNMARDCVSRYRAGNALNTAVLINKPPKWSDALGACVPLTLEL